MVGGRRLSGMEGRRRGRKEQQAQQRLTRARRSLAAADTRCAQRAPNRRPMTVVKYLRRSQRRDAEWPGQRARMPSFKQASRCCGVGEALLRSPDEFRSWHGCHRHELADEAAERWVQHQAERDARRPQQHHGRPEDVPQARLNEPRDIGSRLGCSCPAGGPG